MNINSILAAVSVSSVLVFSTAFSAAHAASSTHSFTHSFTDSFQNNLKRITAPFTVAFAPPPPPALPGLYAEQVFSKLKFVNPTAMVQSPRDNSKLYVVEKTGKISVFQNPALNPARPEENTTNNITASQVFLDLSDRTAHEFNSIVGQEEGVLNLVFHPRWDNGVREAFVYYNVVDKSLPGNDEQRLFVRVSRFKSVDNGRTLNKASEEIILQIKKDQRNHNGSAMAFDRAGLLYIGVGDGGVNNDGNQRAQDKARLLGKVLRIDIDRKEDRKSTRLNSSHSTLSRMPSSA